MIWGFLMHCWCDPHCFEYPCHLLPSASFLLTLLLHTMIPGLRRSARNAGRPQASYTDAEPSLFPEGPPTNPIEKIFHALNLEAFQSTSYARVDDILVHALFATKSRPHSYRALHPEPAGDSSTSLQVTDNDGINMAKIINAELKWNNNPLDPALADFTLKEDCNAVAIKILHAFPQLFHRDSDLPIIKQYVIKFHSLCKKLFNDFSQPSTALYSTPLNSQFNQN
jgi:hypothetical protein